MTTTRTKVTRFATNGPRGQATTGIVDGAREDDTRATSFSGPTSRLQISTPLGRAVDITDPHGARVTALMPMRRSRSVA